MRNAKHNWIKRSIAMLLVVVSLVQWIPANALAADPQDTGAQNTTYTPGDVNGDGKINALDVNLVRRHIAGGYDVQINTLAADVNTDGYVTEKDLTELRQYIVGGYGTQLTPGLERFTVRFETGGGTAMEDKVVFYGTPISTFDKPYQAEHIFLGWCYDAALTQPVASTDTVNRNMTLYANWLEQVPLETLDTANFTSAQDVSSGFTIGVLSSDPTMTADDVLAAIDADDLADPNAQNIIAVSGSNGSFTVSGAGGFKEGGSYRITLGSDMLSFADQPREIRQYNLTIHRDEVMNLTMQGDIKYLPLEQVSNIINNGQRVSTLDIALYEANGNTVTMADLSIGSFTYTGTAAVQEGDIVCVYEGEIPTNRTKDTPKSQLGDMAYLEITGVNGNSYTYESAEAEEVLFMPDVLPMPETADTDDSDATITVENKYLDYSADIYSYVNLDSQTTVEPGDFLAFYTGEYGVGSGENAAALTGYGKITGVTDNGDDTTTIAFVQVTWNDVEACMDIYTEEEMSASELLEGVDTENMESEIEQQAMDSGFAEEAALYLTSLALATDNFNALSEKMNLEDYKVTLTDGEPVSPEQLKLMSGGSVQVEIVEKSVKARIGKNPTHLGDIEGTNADQQGITISLDVQVVFTIGAAGSDGHLEITVTGSFTEEVGVDFGASADAVWDWAGIIPYISDIQVSANVDTMNYTAVSFNATMVTKENDDDDDGDSDALDIANEIKDLLSDLTKGEEQSDDVQNKMIQRYSEMLSNESDWIKLLEYNIVTVEKGIPFNIPLINIFFSVDFVVQLDASISVGFDFEYTEGKRHVFTVSVKDRNVYSDTIDLQEKAYEFCFYAMGRLGLRAGVEMEFGISVISKKLGSVGFVAGAGAYTKLYGYFFYELNYTKSQGKTQAYSGALLIQVGIYLELGLEAQALGGMFSARANLLDKEWMLYEAGRRDNVLDFVIEQEEVPALVMRQFVRQIQLSDDFFNMNYLDLLTGKSETAVYNDWNDPERADDFRNGENYVITMTNDKFTYDPLTNTVEVHPEEGDLKVTGEMIITWKKQPMSFSSKPITRTVSLYWDNLRDGYMIVPYTNGGSYIPMIVKNFEAQVPAPADPEKLGYEFAGWYSDATFETPYTFPELMPANDANVYAKWEARTDITYTVEHHKEEFRSGEYELAETEVFQGTTDTVVTPAVKTYTGYISPAQAELKINADGSAVLRYYYNLERHNITFDAGTIDGVEVTAESDVTYNLKYGAPICAPQMAMRGYTFVGWTTDGSAATSVASVVGTEDLTYTAMWEKNADTPYRIEYYVQQTDGRYTLQHMIKGETATGKVFTAEYLRDLAIDGATTADQKFLQENAIAFENMTVSGIVCDSAAVDGSGKTVIKINYGRLKHTLTFDLNYEGSEPIVKEVFYGAEIIVPQNVSRTGYTFTGWQVAPVQTMPAESLTYLAQWTPNTYTVHFDKDHPDATGAMESMAFTYDEAKTLTANGFTRPYYDFAGWALQSAGAAVYQDGESVMNLTAAVDGQVTVYAVWTPVEYTITYQAQNGTHSNPATYNTLTDTIHLGEAARLGYTFDGWYDNAAFEGDAVTQILKGSGGDVTLYAKWIPNEGTAYQVAHYQQQLDGSYSLVDTDHLTGTTDSAVTPALKSYTGFTAPAAKTETIAGDGSLVVEYHYTRNSYTITFDAAGGTVTPDSITAQYGEAITLPTPERAGYGFNGWFHDAAAFNEAAMGAADLTVVASWEAGKIGYTVKHYQQNVDGAGYTEVKTVSGTADMDSTITPELETYEGFTAPSSATTITIKANAAENVVEYYYTRDQYTLTWNLGIGSTGDQSYTSGTVYYGAEVIAPDPVKTGYSYQWDATPVTVMPVGDLTYTANWTANIYKVSFNVNGGTVVSGDTTQREIAFDSIYGELAVLEKAGYTFEGWYDGDTEITAGTILNNAADHTLTAKFTLISYDLTFHGVSAEEHTNPAQYNTEEAFALVAPAGRTGYTFEGWYENETFSGDPAVKIDSGSIGNKTFYAKWTENTYDVIFHANNGTTEETNKNLLYTDAFGENTFTRDGYIFLGWSDGISDTVYGADDKLSAIVTDSTGALHLYAVWQKQRYTITYENVDASGHDNATEYTVEDTVSLSEPDSRPGYTFHGWFDNAAFEGTPVEIITAGSLGHKIFYALWEENTYTVVLNANDGTGASTTTEPILYTGFLPGNTFTREGYTFLGWSTTASGAKAYADNAAVSKIIGGANSNNQVTLYAVWKANEYTISYSNWNIGASSNPNTVTVYSVERDGDITLKNPTPKTGYQFLGWYEGNSKVTTIQKTAGKNYNLVAKWAHGGTFTISYSSRSSVSGGYEAKYTVTRTLPTGTVATSAPQVVYVRTVNGTAYGTTPETFGSSGQDKYHFAHVNPTKEGSGIVTFGSNDFSKTVTIKESDDYHTNNIMASYQIGGKARYYNVELYRVVDSTGVCNGQLGSTKSVKRTLPVSSYQLSSSFYSWHTTTIIGSSAITITDSGYGSNDWRDIYPDDLMNSALTTAQEKYRDAITSYYGFYITFDVKENDDGYQWVKFTNATGRGGSVLAEYHFATKDGEVASNWGRNLSLPRYNTSASGDIQFSVGDCVMQNNWTVVNASTPYARISQSKDMSICFDASGKNDDDWQYRNLKVHLKVYDSSEPKQLGLAPMALTEYRAGDKITFTVIYNEMVDRVSGMSFNLPSVLRGKVSNVSYVGGAGTNALVFTGTVTSGFRFDTSNNSSVNNEAIVNYTSAASGAVWDIIGN